MTPTQRAAMTCPFCGSKRIGTHYKKSGAKSGYQCMCLDCKVAQTGCYHPSIDAAREEWSKRAALAEQPAEQERDGAMNAICKMFHHGEEVESDDGMAMLVPLDLWHDAIDALDSLIGDEETIPEAPQPAKRVRLTDDEWFEFWDNCQAIPSDSGFPEFLQIARAIERAHGIGGGI